MPHPKVAVAQSSLSQLSHPTLLTPTLTYSDLIPMVIQAEDVRISTVQLRALF